MTSGDLPRTPVRRGAAGEAVSLLPVFAAAFLAGRAVGGAAGDWWGALAGSVVFVGVTALLPRFVSRPSPASAGAAGAPGAAELAGFLLLFLVPDLVGVLVARAAGSAWWGLAAGCAALVLLLLLLLRLAAWGAKPLPPEPVAAGPATEVAWLEPRGFRRGEVGETRRWILAMILFTVAATLVFAWIAGRSLPGAGAQGKVLIAGGGIVALFLCFLAVAPMMRIGVRVGGGRIVQDLGEDSRTFRFVEIDHGEIGTMINADGTWRVLVAELANGDREVFCLDPSIPEEDLRRIMEAEGVAVLLKDGLLREEPPGDA